MPAKNRSNEIRLTRLYDAPVAVVWDAWTDPEQVGKWWGPRGFTLTTHGKDLRPGGFWKYTMHGPDNTDYPNNTVYHEVERHRRLVYDHGGNDDRPPLFRVMVVFTELQGKTKMEMSMAFATPEVADEMNKFIKKASGYSTWDRLGEYLEKTSTGKDKFIINHAFDAPIARVYEMWTNPEHFSKWLAPKGFTMKFLRADIKVGGSTLYFMSNGDTMKMYGRAHYLELRSPHRLVYTQQFCDEQERIARHPAAPTWPETMLTTVTLTEEAPDRTRVTVTWEPHGAVTPEELDTFIKQRTGMTAGWTGSFDQLEALLEA